MVVLIGVNLFVWWFMVTNLTFVLSYKKPSFCNQDADPYSFLWSIKRDPPSYLFGTIHVPYTKVWDHIPDNAKQAFAVSSKVFFELDLVNPTTVSALSSCQMLPQGKNLSDVLPGDLYARLKRHLEYVRGMMPRWMTADQRGRGLYYADYLFNAIAGNWERKRPVWVMLMVNSLTESDVRSRGVPVLDLYLAQEAERLKKKTAAVEKVEEQCLPLNGLNFTQVLFALNHTLLQHELRENDPTTPYTTDDLIRHYNCGDLDSASFGTADASLPPIDAGNDAGASTSWSTDARNIDLYFRSELIDNRNRRMGNRVAELVRENPGQSLFFAFGAGHFLGNNTVLDFVQSHGFEIEHLSVNTKIPKSKSKKSINPDQLKPALRLSGSLESSSRKGPGRRSNRQRSVPPAGGLNLRNILDTTSSPPPITTLKSRQFNDLWVRMDSYKRDKLKPPDERIQDPPKTFQSFAHHASSSTPNTASSILHLIGLIWWLAYTSRLCDDRLTGVT